jgi:hypothetical protein
MQLCKEPYNGHPYILWVQLCLLRESYYLCSLNTVILGTEYMLVLIWGFGTLRYKKGDNQWAIQALWASGFIWIDFDKGFKHYSSWFPTSVVVFKLTLIITVKLAQEEDIVNLLLSYHAVSCFALYCKSNFDTHPYIVWVELCLLRESYYVCSLSTVILGTEYMLVLIWGIGTLPNMQNVLH